MKKITLYKIIAHMLRCGGKGGAPPVESAAVVVEEVNPCLPFNFFLQFKSQSKRRRFRSRQVFFQQGLSQVIPIKIRF